MYNSESKTTGREQVDVTGLIGQYAHGNEPSHHMAYLYNYVGKPEKTNAKVKYILDNFYTNTPDGLIGNEDCGQMSAWYVLSSMGIYSVTPGQKFFNTVQANFENIKINIDKKLINFPKTNEKEAYFISFDLNEWIKALEHYPIGNYLDIITAPIIVAESKSFKDKLKIEIKSQNPKDVIYYLDVTKVDKESVKDITIYQGPFEISETSTIEFHCQNKDGQSNTISATFFKKPNNYSINIKSVYNPQYHAGGPEGLLDGILGTENWRKGDWQGYQSQDFEAVVDLKEVKPVKEISARFLQDSRSWILMPTKVEYYISEDNVSFEPFGTVSYKLDSKEENNTILNFTSTNFANKKARYVKVIAKNFGKLPEWHQGAGGDAFIFVDEITIK
jgi:hypothetical protein